MFFEVQKENDLFVAPFSSLKVGDVFILCSDYQKDIGILDVYIKIECEYLCDGTNINAISTFRWETFEIEEDAKCYIVDMKNPIISYNNIRRLS